MNILLINDAAIKSFLQSKGHRVIACGAKDAPYNMPGQDDFDFYFKDKNILDIRDILDPLPADFSPDILILSECYKNFFFLGIEEVDFPVIWRPIDNHIHSWQPDYAAFFDMTFIAQKDYIGAFRERGRAHIEWLPLNCFPDIHYNRNLERDLDISFAGNLDVTLKPKRARFLDELQEKIKVNIFDGLNQEEISVIYNRSKIVINECMHEDLNYRVFETMANGALLLTPEIQNGQPDIFENEKHLVCYRNFDAVDAYLKCENILNNWDRYRIMAQEAQKTVLTQHSIENRARRMWELIQQYAQAEFNKRKQKITAKTYIQFLPVFSALHKMNFIDFRAISYCLDKIKSRDNHLGLLVAEDYLNVFRKQGLVRHAAGFSSWLKQNK